LVENGKTRATVKLNKNFPNFNKIIADIKEGFLDSSSIEYKATKWTTKLVNNTAVRVITGIKILGFALTGRPANPAAKINSFFCKSFDFVEEKEVWTRAYINDLPDSAFAYIEKGGKKDETGKTTPRSLRHLPYKGKDGKVDLPHLRNALSRLPQTDLSSAEKAKAKKKLYAAAKSAGVSIMSKKSFDKVILVDEVELKEDDEVQTTAQEVASEPEANPKQEVEVKPEVQEKPEQQVVEETKPVEKVENKPDEKPKEEPKPTIDPKDIEELKKRIDSLEAEKKVLIAKTEQFEKQKVEQANQEIETYKQNPSWNKAGELASKKVSFRY